MTDTQRLDYLSRFKVTIKLEDSSGWIPEEFSCGPGFLREAIDESGDKRDERFRQSWNDVRMAQSQGPMPGTVNCLPYGEKFNLKHMEGKPDFGAHIVELEAKRIIEANRTVNCPPWCDTCKAFHRPGDKCEGKL